MGSGVRLISTFACACALLLAGCGGSSSPQLGKTALATKANAICTHTNASLKQVGKAPDSTKAFGPYFAKVNAALRTEHASLSNLNPAGDVQKAFHQYVDNEQKVINDFATARTKALAGNAAGLQAAEQSTVSPGKLVLAAANELGWTVCAQSG